MVVGARERFAERLTALYELAGSPVVKSLLRRANARGVPGAVNVTGQRFSDWRRGKTVPASFDAVLPVLAVLIGDAKAQPLPETVDHSLLDLPRWRVYWRQAKNDPGLSGLRVRDPGHPPYRGLSPYRAEDHDLYFGRDSARESVVQAIAAVEADPNVARLVLVVGVSGVGKSSLLAAGLQAHAGHRTPILICPGAHPGKTLRAGIDDAPADAELLLLIDQGEELFTLCSDTAERRVFVDELAELTAPDAARKVTAVLAIRSDFFNDLIQYPVLAGAMRDASVIIGAMTEPELREAIVGPARACGLNVEPALVDIVLRDLDAAASDDGRAALLPLLSHVLHATWARRRGRTLTLEAYRAAGGMAGSVSTTAEQAWHALTPRQQSFARSILMTLTVIGPRSVTRNHIAYTALVDESTDPELAADVVARLVDARLIVVDSDTVQLLHDAVPRVWPRMAEWVAEEKEFGPARHRIEEDARAWSAAGRPKSLLYEAKRLETVDVVTGNGGSVNRIAKEFVAESVRHQLRVSARRRVLRSAAALLGVVALFAGALATQQHRAIERERIAAQVDALIHNARRTVDFDPQLSERMALQAYRMRPDDAETRAHLVSTQVYPVINASDARHAGRILGLSYYAPGNLLASTGEDGLIRLWELAGSARAVAIGDSLRGHQRSVTSAAFAPDGRILASAGYDRRAQLWDVRDPKQPRALGAVELSAPVRALAYAPDGRSIVAATDDGQLTSVDVADPAAPRVRHQVRAHEDTINALAISADGATLVSASDDRTVRIWDPAEFTPIGAPLRTDTAVRSVALGPNDRLMAGTASGALHMWTLTDRAAPQQFGTPQAVHSGPINALAFGPQGQMISGSGDGKVCLWQQTVSGFQPFGRPFGGNRGPVSRLAVTSDARVLTAGNDGRVRVWTRPSADIPVSSTAPFTSVEVDDAGSRMVTGSDDGRFQVWRVSADSVTPASDTRATVQPYHGVVVQVRPDGTVLAAADDGGGSVELWDLRDPDRPVPLGPPLPTRTRYFTATAFSADNRLLVTGDDDASIRLWDVTDPAAPHALGGASIDSARAFRVLALSPDSSLVAVGSRDSVIYLWDISDRRNPVLRARLTGHGGPLSALAFAADGRHLFSSAEDETIRTWDLATLDSNGRVETTSVRTATVVGLSLDRTGRRLVSSGVDQSVRIWDVDDPTQPRPLGRSISLDLGARWFVRFDRTGDDRVFGISNVASERWTTDPAKVADTLCEAARSGFDSEPTYDVPEFDPTMELCPGQDSRRK
ncbi:hypothetical protein F5X71_07410 [Nocardia brasiliensis]|uniref:Novel STAND NTPase 1 domain-containing protein n=1 Tax=Nocardia brasiliensis TaxID=37326 RepID=A0A6G9XML8_NOCBR|nr:WD40 repeat domain-containing protein [Nocardia brasiliensis]QIS02167.1 hypothetical protein F5X71_07410 [Nocardia brasiliensis]